MTKLSRVFVQSAAAAALSLSGLTLGATAATAQPWSHDETRCTNDACATYNCNWDGCTRVSGWRYNNDYRGYYYNRDYDNGYYIGRYDRERCYGDRCATFRCDSDGDNCTRLGSWHYRY
ncbi:MAG TPA: hypothetical protein VG407_02255 [Caulobacteraceae bacterium]|jgi:hypothetical protein|nr:hypothetical protein [Caulobacteraceae bacterium]